MTRQSHPSTLQSCKHADKRVDDYYWLRHKQDPAVLAYLQAENVSSRHQTAQTV